MTIPDYVRLANIRAVAEVFPEGESKPRNPDANIIQSSNCLVSAWWPALTRSQFMEA